MPGRFRRYAFRNPFQRCVPFGRRRVGYFDHFYPFHYRSQKALPQTQLYQFPKPDSTRFPAMRIA